MNREAKLVKLHTVDGDVWAGVEVLHAQPQEFVAALPRYLSFLQEAVRAFRDVMLAAQEAGDAEEIEDVRRRGPNPWPEPVGGPVGAVRGACGWAVL